MFIVKHSPDLADRTAVCFHRRCTFGEDRIPWSLSWQTWKHSFLGEESYSVFSRSCETLIHSGAVVIFDLGVGCRSLAWSLKLSGSVKRSCKSLTNNYILQCLFIVLRWLCSPNLAMSTCIGVKGWHRSLPLEKDDANDTMECDKGRTQEKMECCHYNSPCLWCLSCLRKLWACCILYSMLVVLLCLSESLDWKTSQMSVNFTVYLQTINSYDGSRDDISLTFASRRMYVAHPSMFIITTWTKTNKGMDRL